MEPISLAFASERFNTQKMCDEAVREERFSF